jgi:hypothetical protein
LWSFLLELEVNLTGDLECTHEHSYTAHTFLKKKMDQETQYVAKSNSLFKKLKILYGTIITWFFASVNGMLKLK